MNAIPQGCTGDYKYIPNFPWFGIFLYGKFEDAKTAAIQFANNHTVLTLVIIYWLWIPMINATNQGVTKYLSGNVRSLSSILKMTIIWMAMLIIGW